MSAMRAFTSAYNGSKPRGTPVKQRLGLLRHFVKPVKVGKTEETFKACANGSLESPHAVRITNRELLKRFYQPVRVHQQCRLLKAGNQEQQKMLVPEVRQYATLRAAVERRVRRPQHNQGIPATEIARVGRWAIRPPKPVATKASLEIAHRDSRVQGSTSPSSPMKSRT